MTKEYGYSKKGERIYQDISGNRKKNKRITVISGYINRRNLVSPVYIEDCYTDTEVFNIWLKNHLLPNIKQKDLIIMDNAAFHKSNKTRELIESKGAKLLYLPPYSPDLNPIENKWGSIKKLVRRIKDQFDSFTDCLDYVLLNSKG